MVRRIVAALMRVGHGNATVAEVAQALEEPSRPAFDGETAAAKGLCLAKVTLGRPKRKMESRT
jgi:tRNA U38,U39,U40 pseudouridine synthase TruA